MSELLTGYLTQDEACAALGVSRQALARWRARRFGPPIVRLANRVYYRRDSLARWVAAQERDPAVQVKSQRRG